MYPKKKAASRRFDSPWKGGAVSDQKGITLIVVMIMLVLISLASTSAIRSSGNSESIANNARTQSLAFHAAEVGLKFCEDVVLPHMEATVAYYKSLPSATATTPTLVSGFVLNTAPTVVPGVDPPYLWKAITTTWDLTSSVVINVVDLSNINASTTDIYNAYKRSPECLAEYSIPGNFSRAVITARGFGPEVASGRGKPIGTEVWLQSTLQVPN
jgi:Tfp pilus assembly protein PilX